MREVIAIACADIHLSHNPPIARAGEPDWYEAMARSLNELSRIHPTCPKLCAGDIFHTWRPPPALINFAFSHLPRLFAIPGQHDLPYHDINKIEESAYTTLTWAEHGPIHPLRQPTPLDFGHGVVHPFPWGTPVTPCPEGGKGIQIALVHAYTWADGADHPGAPAEGRWDRLATLGYDIVITGDNHKPFERALPPPHKGGRVFNCGGFMRRNSDEIDHRPSVGLIMSDGTIERHYLDCSKDVLVPISPVLESRVSEDLDGFLEQLKVLQGSTLDYPEALRSAMNAMGVTDTVRGLLLSALEAK